MLDLRRWFLVLTAVFLASVSPQPRPHGEDCALCVGERKLECRRCEGEGTRMHPCSRCSGSQRIGCLFCYDGKSACPACDGAKEIRWDGGAADPCKVCNRKGTVKCTFCKGRDSIPCNRCKGKGKLEQNCTSCIGLGFLPCPDDRTSPCLLCRDRGMINCSTCEAKGTLPAWCTQCGLTGDAFCKHCDLYGIDVCSKCYGSGNTRSSYEGSSKSNKDACATCKRKGFKKCKRCKGGIIPCQESPTVDCPNCEEGRVDCRH